MRHDLARGRARRPAAGVRGRDPAGPVLHPALRQAGGRDGSGHRLRPVRRASPWPGPRSAWCSCARTAATAAAYGLECELITPRAGRRAVPDYGPAICCGALWLPGDGTANPVDLTAALARGAGSAGVRDRASAPGSPASPSRDGAGDRRPHRPAATSRPRSSSTAPASGRSGRRVVRRRRAAALGRALLRGDRAMDGRRSRPAHSARPGRLHLLQGGGGRPGGRAASSPRPSRGWRPMRCRTRSSSSCSRRTGTTSAC